MLIINRLGDVQRAIEFAREQDDEDIWEDLLRYSEDKPRTSDCPFLSLSPGADGGPVLFLNSVYPRFARERRCRHRSHAAHQADSERHGDPWTQGRSHQDPARLFVAGEFYRRAFTASSADACNHPQISLLEGCQKILDSDSNEHLVRLYGGATHGLFGHASPSAQVRPSLSFALWGKTSSLTACVLCRSFAQSFLREHDPAYTPLTYDLMTLTTSKSLSLDGKASERERASKRACLDVANPSIRWSLPLRSTSTPLSSVVEAREMVAGCTRFLGWTRTMTERQR